MKWAFKWCPSCLDRVAFFLTCCIVGAAVVALYPMMLSLLRVIRKEELNSFPAPLRKVLRPFMRLQRTKVN